MSATSLRPAVRAAAPVDDYVAFCEGLRHLTGIDLSLYRRPQMERRLRAFMERRQITCLTDALPRLRADAAELDTLLDRLTINVSQLWRHPDQWVRLADQVLPELAAEGRIRAWSAGCSYGAEAFTLAAVCRKAVPGAGGESWARLPVSILGTDIDRRMIDRARTAVFSAEDARGVDVRTLTRHFERVEGGWRAPADLRAMTRFAAGDLLADPAPANAFDLVMCRNTVIYFSDTVRDALHARLAASLRPGGWLVVGATERVNRAPQIGLEPIAPFFYRRVA